MIAARMPIPSLDGGFWRSDCWMSGPPRCTSSPSFECASARSIIWRPTETGTSWDFSSSCALASAIFPDFEMRTRASCRDRSRPRREAPWRGRQAGTRPGPSPPGSCIVGVPFITTCTASPDWALKLAANMLVALVDSVLGALKLVVKFVPVTPATTCRPTSVTTHVEDDELATAIAGAGERAQRHLGQGSDPGEERVAPSDTTRPDGVVQADRCHIDIKCQSDLWS